MDEGRRGMFMISKKKTKVLYLLWPRPTWICITCNYVLNVFHRWMGFIGYGMTRIRNLFILQISIPWYDRTTRNEGVGSTTGEKTDNAKREGNRMDVGTGHEDLPSAPLSTWELKAHARSDAVWARHSLSGEVGRNVTDSLGFDFLLLWHLVVPS